MSTLLTPNDKDPSEPANEWGCDYTREEMLEQQSRLLIQECHLLQRDLARCRKNLAKLIEMHTCVSIERDRLRGNLKITEAQLSDCLREKALLGNRVAGLEGCRDQLNAILKAERRTKEAMHGRHYD